MPPITPALRELAAIIPGISRYVAAAGTCGAAAGFLSPHLDLNVAAAFTLGCLLPLGPLVWLCNGRKWVESDLDTWKQWESTGRITQAEARELRRTTLKAMQRHRYGTAVDGPEESKPADSSSR